VAAKLKGFISTKLTNYILNIGESSFYICTLNIALLNNAF